ncbi:MAG: thiolase [Chloroflexi bacterium]|nr:MAG: thiolase [Chloroflexota bacterium]
MSADLSKYPVYIAGVAESPLGEVHDQTELSMVALAAQEALAEAGMTLRDVDAIFTNYMGEEGSVQLADYLGLQPRYADSSDMGGGSFEVFCHHAMLALAAGRCEVALIGYASRQRTRRSRVMAWQSPGLDLIAQFETPYAAPMPIGQFALVAARHMYQYGTTPEQLAEVAVAARQWAQRNPKAWKREPLRVADVLESRMICSPLRRDDICLVTDGGGAVVLTTRERARNAAKRPVRVLGAGESHFGWSLTGRDDITVSAGVVSGREAFGMAGITPADVDVFQPYDAFTISVLIALEDLGFCAKGESGAFVEGGALAPGGRLPSMTSGGGLSYCHPGALGILLLIEAVRQLRGEAGERQVEDAEIAVAHGIGGLYACAATVVLARD